MDVILHKNNSRGHANHGWLNSHHTFSFAGYMNPERVHFGAIRVLNDDIVKGGTGFGRHPHANMEIVSIPLAGALEHRDSTGRHKIIRTGEVQIMSAGTGIEHSEFNASRTDDVNFLQIWILPDKRNIEPRYDQKEFSLEDQKIQLVRVVAPDDDSALWINQNAWFHLGDLDTGSEINYELRTPGHGVYIFVVEGELEVADQTLSRRDGLGITNLDALPIKAKSDSKVLLIETTMEV